LSAAAIITLAWLLAGAPTASAATTAEPSLQPYGPSTVGVPFTRLYLLAANCHQVPCEIDGDSLTVSAHGRKLAGLIHPTDPILRVDFVSDPSTETFYATWLTPSEVNARATLAAIRRYGPLTLHDTETITDAQGSMATTSRMIHLVARAGVTTRHYCPVSDHHGEFHAVRVRTNVSCAVAEAFRSRIERESDRTNGNYRTEAVAGGYWLECGYHQLGERVFEIHCFGEHADIRMEFVFPTPPPAPSAPSPSSKPPRPAESEAEGVGAYSHSHDAEFCSTHTCIGEFTTEPGYIVECKDGTFSHAGGIQGACSHHGGEARAAAFGRVSAREALRTWAASEPA
jgi:hypothetical protein